MIIMTKEYNVKDNDTVEEVTTVVTSRKGKIYHLPSLIEKRDELNLLIDELTLVILEKEDAVAENTIPN